MDMPAAKYKGPPPYNGVPRFVKLAFEDDGDYLPHIFYTHPKDHVAVPGILGEVHAWGLYKYVSEDGESKRVKSRTDDLNWPSFDGIEAMWRQMTSQRIYMDDTSTPQSQWMKYILDKKRNKLQQLDLKGLDKHDVLITIYISAMRDRRGMPRVWRRLRVSAGVNLGTFQDKIIAPIMGWVRNLHCYTFTDYRDGSLYGPEGSDCIDKMHIAQVGYEYLPDHKYKLAHLFGKEGDRIGYLYDFGDKWFHNIEVEKIYPLEDSHGEVEILSGRGMCPGENMHGSLQYADMLNKMETSMGAIEKFRKKKEILESPNYNDFGKPPSQLDLDFFDIDAARLRLSEALGAPLSVRTGSKKFSMPIGAQSIEEVLSFDGKLPPKLKKAQQVTVTMNPETLGHGFWYETESNTKDRRAETVCAQCGKPAGNKEEFKTCAGCRSVLYCSADHQRMHWKKSHKRECTRQYVGENKDTAKETNENENPIVETPSSTSAPPPSSSSSSSAAKKKAKKKRQAAAAAAAAANGVNGVNGERDGDGVPLD